MIKILKKKSKFDIEFGQMQKDFEKTKEENDQNIQKGFELVRQKQKEFDKQMNYFRNKRQ